MMRYLESVRYSQFPKTCKCNWSLPYKQALFASAYPSREPAFRRPRIDFCGWGRPGKHHVGDYYPAHTWLAIPTTVAFATIVGIPNNGLLISSAV